MKKRELTEEERKLTNKGIQKRKEEIKELKEAIQVNEVMRDIIMPYNRRIEDQNKTVIIKKHKEDLEIAELDIKNLKKQLREGVKVKEAAGVN